MNDNDFSRRRALRLLQEKLGYQFESPDRLELALTHTSWANEHNGGGAHNQRLEFLGDAVLELCVSDEIYRRFPQAREGAMTETRSRLVSEPALAELARYLGLDRAILLGRGEERQEGREKDSLLADAFEAVLAAIYVDGGFFAARKVVARLYEDLWPESVDARKKKDPKSLLQEKCWKLFRQSPVYTQLEASGPAHARIFDVKLVLPDGREFLGRESSSKKAEQDAATKALANMPENE